VSSIAHRSLSLRGFFESCLTVPPGTFSFSHHSLVPPARTESDAAE
jgi:hypothetical protein